ncbi:MAG TPA: hypothetical protein VIG08_17525 [Gemmatimonadales bacterium]|jgi:hypothetical protein
MLSRLHRCSIALALVFGAPGLAAQAIGDSTMSTVPPDSVTVGVADTSASPAGSIAPPPATGSRPAMVVEVPPAVDTVVARACGGAAPGTSAPGLIGVVFRAHATEGDRAAAAREVGGTLANAGDGSKAYIQLPDGGVPVRTAASRIIQLSWVSGVSEISCPR